MPLDISSDAITEKNKITSDAAWLLLLKIAYEGETPGYVCLNNEQVVWPSSGGNTFLPAIFSLSGIEETKEAEIPAVTLSVIDLSRSLLPFIEDYDGGVGATITIYVVHSDHLDNTTAEVEEEMEVIDVSVDHSHKITFKLGAENLMTRRCPQHRYLKNHCRFVFKDSRCGYSSSETECNRTLTRCKELSNETRYGGFPGVGSVGVQV